MPRIRIPSPTTWTAEQIEYLESAWGDISLPTLAKKLGRSINAIKLKANRIGLGRYLESGEYITLNQLMIALGHTCSNSYSTISWIEKRGLPIKNKRVINRVYRIINLKDFWNWAENNRTFIDFSKFERKILGPEPAWVEEQRKADELFSAYKKTPWTDAEDEQLKNLLNAYKYSYRDISVRLMRTEGAIKKRMCDLGIKQRPLKADNHILWTNIEIEKLIELRNNGYKPEVIAQYINRSALAIRGKLERMGMTK